MSVPLPAVIPVNRHGEGLLPVPPKREPNHIAKDGSILRDSFEAMRTDLDRLLFGRPA